MMNLKTLSIALLALGATCLASCDDWTDTESIQVNAPNDEGYETPEYLEALRAYKKTLHPLMIGWFDNSLKDYASMGEHIAQVPDKLDILSLMVPDDLDETELKEMNRLQTDKGTRVLYTIDCQAFQDKITAMNNDLETENEELINEGKEPLPLIVLTDTLAQFMDMRLALLDKYPYDGMTVLYNGKATGMIPADEIAEMDAVQKIIFEKTAAAIDSHPGKTYMYEGLPQFLRVDKTVLMKFDYLVIHTYTSTSAIDITREVIAAVQEQGVPTDRVIVSAAPRFSQSGTTYGNMVDLAGLPSTAIKSVAEWVKTDDTQAFTKAGMGVWKINKDYYIPSNSYAAVKEAINIMNPSPN
ncbi:MAG: glycoside hydrolase family 18 [Mediterranea sp.]|jgi:predicted regulator of amino acid metabolism with ACT domain|nr:glycoside hydrolase family 18 [Mediterranea sp.]